MAKKKIPAIIFNKTNYKYPKGLRVVDENELYEKLTSGDWDTGPVDKIRPERKSKSREIKILSNEEKQALINKYSSELGVFEEVDIIDDSKEKMKNAPPEQTEPAKKTQPEKYLSHMNLSELFKKAGEFDIKINENWTRTELMNVIRKYQKNKG